jgi:hypothetical protein
MRPNDETGMLKKAPHFFKAIGIARLLRSVDYLIYLDLDLLVMNPTVDFVAR